MPRSCSWAVAVLLLCSYFLGCSQPPTRDAPDIFAAEPVPEHVDLAITQEMDDPLRSECEASVSDDPRSERMNRAERDARVDYCIRRTRELNAASE